MATYVAHPLHFLPRISVRAPGGSTMTRFWVWRAAAMMLIGALLLAIVPAPLQAQNVTADAGSRKVRSKVVPAYPDLARQSHITGKVRITATVMADGRVTSVKVLGGSPVLASVATDALNK